MAYAVARDCGWRVLEFHWRPVYCTLHMCFVQRQRENDSIAILIGGDAPIVALSATSHLNEAFRYVDDAAFDTAISGYAPSVHVLPASELARELSAADVDWLRSLGEGMSYNLNYWRPRTVGEVIFNTWD